MRPTLAGNSVLHIFAAEEAHATTSVTSALVGTPPALGTPASTVTCTGPLYGLARLSVTVWVVAL